MHPAADAAFVLHCVIQGVVPAAFVDRGALADAVPVVDVEEGAAVMEPVVDGLAVVLELDDDARELDVVVVEFCALATAATNRITSRILLLNIMEFSLGGLPACRA